MRGRVLGAARVRRIMRGMPGAFRQEMVQSLDRSGKKLQAAVVARTPRRTGALQRGIAYKVLPQSLRLKVGLLDIKPGRSSLFYGKIQDLGRKAQTVTYWRFVKGGRAKYLATAGMSLKRARATLTTKVTMRVRAMPGKKFVTGRYTELRGVLRDELRDIFQRALSHIASGK